MFFVYLVSALIAWGILVWIFNWLKGIRRRVRSFLALGQHNTASVRRDLPAWNQVNVCVALEGLFESGTATRLTFENDSSYSLGLTATVNSNPRLAKVRVEETALGGGELVACVVNAIYLFEHKGQRVCIGTARCSSSHDMEYVTAEAKPAIEALGADDTICKRAIDFVMELAREKSVYRGRAIAVVESNESQESSRVEMQDVPAVKREDIVLPPELMTVFERNTTGFLEHSEALRKAGRSLRHGILLHGAPGVGKTLICRYAITGCKGYTAILLRGQNLKFIRESMQMARMLAPSIVILEDVDLIAEERSKSRNSSILHELMDEMDGIGRSAECIVILTTNRPDILEPALASRPGRIDQAIEFPLPDSDCRRRLITLYSEGLRIEDGVDLKKWVEKLDGVSPALIEEWLRKAALMAAEKGKEDAAGKLKVGEGELDAALRELIVFGGQVTRSLLGGSDSVGLVASER